MSGALAPRWSGSLGGYARTAARRFELVVLATAVGLTLASCSFDQLLIPERDEAAFLQTDSLSYRVEVANGRVELRMHVTYTNRSESPRYLHLCGDDRAGFGLEKRTETGWTPALGPLCPGMARPPLVIAGGESYSEAVTLVGYTSDDAGPRFETSIPGTYRLVIPFVSSQSWGAGASFPHDALAPLEERISNSFIITR